MAGDQATARLKFSTRRPNYEQALELMDRYGCTLPEQLRGRLKLSLGVAMKRAGPRDSGTLLFEAAEIAAANDDSPTMVQAALANTRGFFSSVGRTDQDRVRLLELAFERVEPDDSAHTAKLLANLSVELTFGDQDERRRALSDESLATAERLDDPFCLAHVINQRIGLFWTANGFHERVDSVNVSSPSRRRSGRRSGGTRRRRAGSSRRWNAAIWISPIAASPRCARARRAPPTRRARRISSCASPCGRSSVVTSTW